ncbi:uncharacterized protein LOC129701496 [Leucoraja erinacea]|uniref:uncharacterized protein LOC129701496 n=1 Tax=Leucoraja erinaceus TaxID=7782 RepID=UPI0024578ADE|nr:uncharacterized protein LOC129701496 [Leucoraja erinacea]
MRPKFLCSGFPDGLMFGVFVFLLRSVSTQKIRNLVYFLDNGGNITLKGPDNPGSDVVVWEWKPHSGHGIQTVLTGSRADKHWTIQWGDGWRESDKNQEVDVDASTCNLTIKNNAFKWAGFFTLSKTQPRKQILKQYEIFGIKVEASPQRPLLGSDVTLSCTISRLSDTVSLHWRPMDSSQQNRSNTDQIRLNNTVYLMVRHVTVEDGKLYVCEVQENGKIVHTSKANFNVTVDIYSKRHTLYRTSTDHSEVQLVCYFLPGSDISSDVCTWTYSRLNDQDKVIASATFSQPINVANTAFKNRLMTSVKHFKGEDFSVRIVPVLFEDAGVYKCSAGTYPFLTIDLITVKVTAEPSDAVTEGDNVTLTCSVSHVTESMRLVWINGDDKRVGEKTLTVEEKSLSLVIQKVERGRGNWRCGLFHQDLPRLLVPYYQETSGTTIYLFHQEGNYVLKGPDSPGNGPIDLEWRPHSGQQTTKQLATFHREDQQWAVQWSDEYNQIPGISQSMHMDWGTLNLRIRKPIFELAGLFTWNQAQPSGKILRQWELFVIKVEADSPRPVMGSDITLSCTISRLPDTVSLYWKPRGSSQQNRRNNTDQIHLNNTVYLMIQHVGAGNPNLYTWEVLENGSIVLTGDTNVEVDQDLYNKMYTVYRSVTDHSELDLICEASLELNETKWTWRSQHVQNQEKEIYFSHRSEPIHVDMSYFGNRLKTTEGNVNGTNFRVRIVPVQFADAGVYTCYIGSNKYVTIDLITVTAEQSNAATEGDNVTLTCSVSKVTKSMRLVCINGDGKIVGEKISKEPRQEETSLQLIIPKAVADKRNHRCGLFLQNTPKVLIPYGLNALQSNGKCLVFCCL